MKSFEPNKLIKECIEKNDITRLRGTLTGIVVRDRNFSTGDFENNINYIVNEQGIKELFEEFDDSKPLVSSIVKERELSDEDFSDAIYYLKNNFCSERIEDIKKIAEILYPLEIEENKPKKTNGQVKTIIAIVIGIIVLAIIAIKFIK